jgi:hypothetical protein
MFSNESSGYASASFELMATKRMPSASSAGVRDEAIDHALHVGAVVADEDDDRPLLPFTPAGARCACRPGRAKSGA